MNCLHYCRPGFEPECAAELQDWASAHGSAAVLRAERDSAFARASFTPFEGGEAEAPAWRELIFSRQVLVEIAELRDLDPRDRLTPVIATLRAQGIVANDLWVETPDSTVGAELKGLCRSFEAAALGALRKQGLIDAKARRRLHLCFLSGTHLLVALADPATTAPWRMGIPRLKLPHEAPSRSALKIEEAWLTLLDDDEREHWLKPGMSAVDLGAAPGGWTWQLARKSIRVVAVDNGPLRQHVLDSGLVEHVRADGFRFRPRKRVDWVVCDMVEQPSRIASLMGEWLREGHARAALFNLKLPMKKRWQETRLCLDGMAEMLPPIRQGWTVRARQLYHDREEITVVVLPRRG